MKEITKEQLDVLKSENKKILLDVYGTFCGPCKVLLPKLEKIETDYPDVTFIKMDIQKNMDFAQELGITSVPTIMIYDGENLIDRSNGAKPDSYYKEFLDKIK
jgi:thioredoxin